MERKRLRDTGCPVARCVEHVGEWWSILILRDALGGLRRFDEFQKSLDIAPNILTRRLRSLEASGLLERQRYSSHPPRDEYILTDRGRDFLPVIQSLLAWGNRHFAPEGPSVLIVDTATGAVAEPVLIDSVSGRPLSDPAFGQIAGPAASEQIRRRYQRTKPTASQL